RSPGATSNSGTTFIAMSVQNFKAFISEKVLPALATIEGNIRAFGAVPQPATRVKPDGLKNIVRPLIRTGTGDISMAAAGAVDLTGGPILYVTNSGEISPVPPTGCVSSTFCAQLGGIPVYTAGHRVAPFTKTLRDPVDGTAVTITAPEQQSSNFLSSAL